MANVTLYLFNYNNYFNKLCKRKETIQEYGKPLTILQNTNFNPNNGIDASHIFNYEFGNIQPDYMIVVDEYNQIVSRWFVTDVSRTRAGQYKIALLRDTVADFKSQVMNSTCFIEKGYVNNTNPLTFNNENMGFNQKKTSQYLIENDLKTPWLVLYLARRNNEGVYNTFTGSFADQPTTIEDNYTVANLSDYKYFYFQDHNYVAGNEDNRVFYAEYKLSDDLDPDLVQAMSDSWAGFTPRVENETYPKYGKGQWPSFPSSKTLTIEDQAIAALQGLFNDGFESSSSRGNLPLNSYSGYQLGNGSGADNLSRESGKTIKVTSTGKRYRIQIENTLVGTNTYEYKIDKNSYLGGEFRGDFFYYNGIEDISGDINENYYVYCPIDQSLRVTFQEIGEAEATPNPLKYNIAYTDSITKDAPYEIVAAPYFTTTFDRVPGVTGQFTSNGDIALQWFQDIINRYNGSHFAYDLQVVPYCPVDSKYLDSQKVVFCGRDGARPLALGIQLQISNFSDVFNIPNVTVRTDYKLSNELDIYRLVSPTGVGEFQWSPAKNGGSVKNFRVYSTLIPFKPYIRIAPSFSGLYGSNFKDYRGLICGGDFSLPIMTSEWNNYQLNNKYYQAIFDRSIEHQEINNNYQRTMDILGATTGTLSGGASGAAAGAAGGPIGMAVGAGVGIISSAAGGIADIIINEKLREEDLKYQKDQFGYQLGTIKARSQSLSRTTSLNADSNLFPFLEYYTCTDTEVQALKDKLKWNGMTIMVIGKPSNYMNPSEPWTYIQGQLIDIDIDEDYQIVVEINRRLQGGIRIES